MEIMVSSAFGLEAVVKREMIKLGLENPKAIDGKVRAIGTMEDVMRLNVCLRSGDRVLINLQNFVRLHLKSCSKMLNKFRLKTI